jgi:hypothetical protein
VAFAVALGVLAVLGLGVGLTRLIRDALAPPPVEPAEDDPRPSDRSQGQAKLATTLDRAIARLDEGDDPRLAVIDTYEAMDVALEQVGLGPTLAETPIEYLARCMETLVVPTESIPRLTELFEWAMFSDHPVDEAMVSDARAALASVTDHLARQAAMSTTGANDGSGS